MDSELMRLKSYKPPKIHLILTQRFLEPEPLDDPKLVMIVGVVGLVINVIGLLLFGGGHGHSHGGGGDAHGHSHGGGGGDDKETQGHPQDYADSGKDTRQDSGDYSEVYGRGCNPIYGHASLEEGYAHAHVAKAHSNGGYVANGHSNGGFEADDTGSGGGEAGAKKEKEEKDKREKKKQKGSKDTDQMNIRGVFLHVLADALGSVVVIISAGVVLASDPPSDPEAADPRNYVDPTLSLVLVAIIMVSTWPLLRDSAHILMQGSNSVEKMAKNVP